MEYYMICRKCKENFNEKELQSSHDVPHYLGGTDKDGRHWLCVPCHKKYELYVFSQVSSYLKTLDNNINNNMKEIAKDCAMRFFRK